MIVLCVAALLMIPVSRFRDARRTLYAITDRRLITVSDAGKTIKSLRLASIHQVEIRERGSRTTLRIPTQTVGDDDDAKPFYNDLYGVADGLRAWRLLVGEGC